MKKRILSMLIAVLMVVLMIPFSALSVFAAEEVTELFDVPLMEVERTVNPSLA